MSDSKATHIRDKIHLTYIPHLFYSIIQEINDKLDLHNIGEVLCGKLREYFGAEGCELKIVEEDNFFSRIYFAIKPGFGIEPDQLAIENIFQGIRSPLKGSLYGHCIDNNNPFIFTIRDGKTFRDFINNPSFPLYKEAAIKYLEVLPSKDIFNLIVVPIQKPFHERIEDTYQVKSCIVLFNVFDQNLSRADLEYLLVFLNKLLDQISIYIFSAIFFKKANEEINIDRRIKNLSIDSTSTEGLVERITKDFINQLKAPLATVWFKHPTADYLGLHSVYTTDDYCIDSDNAKDIRDCITTGLPQVLRATDSYIGRLAANPDLAALKQYDISLEHNFQWSPILPILCTNQIMALPIRDESKSLIAIIALHPNLSFPEFDKISINSFGSYVSQASLIFKYLRYKSISDNSVALSNKIESIVAANKPENFHGELVKILKDVIDAEACSIFEVRHEPGKSKGIYLMATSDESRMARDKIHTKIYDIDSNSITGYVGYSGESVLLYDLDDYKNFYPRIRNISHSFHEETESGKHKSIIVVPIFGENASPNASKQRPSLIIRCINKKQDPQRRHQKLFSEEDEFLLKYVGTMSEGYHKVFEVLRDRNDLIDLVMHEVNNPITSIQGKINYMIKKETRTVLLSGDKLFLDILDVSLMVSLIKKWSNNMDVLNNLMQGRHIIPTPKKFKLWSDVIENVIYWLTPDLDEYGITPRDVIEMSRIGAAEKNIEVYADLDHFLQVFYNLFSNAIKYKKITRKLQIEIDFQKTENDITVNIADWGVGIDKQSKNFIFERGFRSRYARQKDIKGKGFGLWLCQELLRCNKCEITPSKTKDPTVFSIRIPKELVSTKY
jgi:signal transduction histidine kinase